MKRIINYILVFVGVSVGLMACTHHDEPTPPVPPEEVNRTVLVYMVANNNLGSNGYDKLDIREMQTAARAGDTGAGRLLVYHSPYNAKPHLLEIKATGIDTLLTYDNSVLSVSAARMAEVLADTHKYAPADEYGMVLWSHGTGWVHDGIDEPAYQRSFGEERGKKMNTSTLARVLEASNIDFSFLYFDCCYMMSIETLYELRNTAPFIVGSPTELPVLGMPYDKNVKQLFAPEQPELVAAAQNTFDFYNALTGEDRTCTMSVVRTAAIAPLAEATRAIYEACGAGIPAGYSPQRFSYVSQTRCYYFDYKDYMNALCDAASRPDLAIRFNEAFADATVFSAATPKLWDAVPLDRCNGISTYILTNASSSATGNYKDLDWYADVASVVKFE